MVLLPHFYKNNISDYIDLTIQQQIAGVDLTVKDILKLEGKGIIDFDNSNRTLPNYSPLALNEEDNSWDLCAGGYLVCYNETVEVPASAVGIVLPRSTLMRCGATLCSALWDPGYKGKGIGLLIVTSDLKIYKNARIAQLILFETKGAASELYSGVYQNEGIK